MVVKVFRVGFDVNPYQTLAFDGDDAALTTWSPRLQLRGVSRRDDWEPPPLWIPEPRLKEPDLWTMPVAAGIVFSARAADELDRHLVHAGERLPVRVGDRDMVLLNVLEDIDCLDVAKSTFLFDAPERYAFLRHRLPESSIFKIPQTDFAEVLVHEGLVDQEDCFKHAVETGGYTGLKFVELWDSEEGPRTVDWWAGIEGD